MRSIERLFEKVERQNPGWGSNVVFANVINGKNFSHDRIARMFSKLVDKNEYERSEKKQILKYLYLINEPLKRTKNETILHPSEEKNGEIDIYDIKRDKDGIEENIPVKTQPPEELPF